MKQQDIALIIVIAVIAAGISFFASTMIFSSGKNAELTVSQIDPISAEFKQPNTKYFNAESLNPTQLVQIGDSTHDNPFDKSGQ